MTDNIEIVYLEPPESACFLNMLPITAAQYVVYSSTSSLLPSSFDQVLKNHVLPVGGDFGSINQPFSPSSES
jgi:hypothetical protein